MSYPYENNNYSSPYNPQSYSIGQSPQVQSQYNFGSQNRRESQLSQFKDSPKKSIFGGVKEGQNDYITGIPPAKRSPPRTVASIYQTKPSNIADYNPKILNDEYSSIDRRTPPPSITPIYQTRPSNIGDYPPRVTEPKLSYEPVFANPLFPQQQPGLLSREPSEFQFGSSVNLEAKKNASHKAFSLAPSEHPADNLSVKSHQQQPQNQFKSLSIVPTPSQSNPAMRPSTVVQMDPLAKLNNPTQKLPYFSDKKVVITGASSGIGRAIAMWFLNSGCKVALIGRDLESLINIGKQFPNQALVIKCDLSKDDQPYDTYSTILAEFHGVDILINAAGVLREGDIKTMLPQDFDYIMDVNLRSMFYLSHLFYPELQKSRGSIINLSCHYGTKAFAGLYAYCMSKAGVEALTKHLAHEFAVSGVRVNGVAPGLVETNLLAYRKLPQSEINDIYANAANFTPLKRIASIDDVGKAIIFLCSEAANHITGQILRIDGGRHLTSSGWHQWEGPKGRSLVMESRESLFDTLKGKILTHSTNALAYNEPDKIGTQIKRSSWSTTDHQAHAAVKFAKYHEQDVRHDPKVSVMAMENTFQKIFNP